MNQRKFCKIANSFCPCCKMQVASCIIRKTQLLHFCTANLMYRITHKRWDLKRFKRKWVFSTKVQFSNSYIFATWWCNFLTVKLRLSKLTEFIVWNIKGLRHQAAKIKRLNWKTNWFGNYNSKRRNKSLTVVFVGNPAPKQENYYLTDACPFCNLV